MKRPECVYETVWKAQERTEHSRKHGNFRNY